MKQLFENEYLGIYQDIGKPVMKIIWSPANESMSLEELNEKP